jgi:hypothetical protein
MTGEIAQLISVLRAGRALGAADGVGWAPERVRAQAASVNLDGRVCVQIGVIGHPGEPFTAGPMIGVDAIMDWLDSWCVARRWPCGQPEAYPGPGRATAVPAGTPLASTPLASTALASTALASTALATTGPVHAALAMGLVNSGLANSGLAGAGIGPAERAGAMRAAAGLACAGLAPPGLATAGVATGGLAAASIRAAGLEAASLAGEGLGPGGLECDPARWARGGHFGASQVPGCGNTGPGAIDVDRLTRPHGLPVRARDLQVSLPEAHAFAIPA